MDKKTLSELDFYRIRDQISSFCHSEESAFVMQKIEPFTDMDEILFRKSLGIEWTRLFSSARNTSLLGWPKIYGIAKTLKVGGAYIDVQQVYALGQFCRSVEKAKATIFSFEDELSLKSLPSLCRLVPDMQNPSCEIFRIISPSGELKDLPELREIRTRISALNMKIKGIMHSFTGDQKYSDVLESTVPVLRGGRQVLAVKSGRRSSVPGIVHEVSQSGRTVYIEPEQSVICSNELLEAEFELDRATRKILVELASRLSPYADSFVEALKIMEKLDVSSAAALWGRSMNCVWAENSEDGPMCILNARHPLLGESAVPIDVRFMDGKRVLIITGPNTGGKTVTLKTIALFAMLNQSGFPLPAGEGTRLPVFSGVFADIGDSQCLDESLSTFSGHMKNIARAVRRVNENSLVLLDELGSGTDPEEGAAISMAVLDELIEKRAFVLITTHQGLIKNYGYTHPECINASVEFSGESLCPTYRLLMGVPGESHALDIARKSGIPEKIVAGAREYIVGEKADVSSLIKGLSEKHAELDRMQLEFQKKSAELEEKLFRAEKKALELSRREHSIKKDSQKVADEFLLQSRRELENLVRILKEGEVTREKTLGVKKYISDLTSRVRERDSEISVQEEVLLESEKKLQAEEKKRVSHKKTKKRTGNAEALRNATPLSIAFNSGQKSSFEHGTENKSGNDALEISEGVEVLHQGSGLEGTVVSRLAKGRWTVLFGSIKMTVKESEIVPIRSNVCSEDRASVKPSVVYEASDEAERPSYELRILGFRQEEALRTLEHQIDLCCIHGFKNFSVIHGTGTGVLQQAVRDYLSHSQAVKDFYFAGAEEGGFGKTHVELW